MTAAIPSDYSSFVAPSKRGENAPEFNPGKTINPAPLNEVGYTVGTNPELPCPTCDAKIDDGRNENPDCFAKRVGENQFLVRVNMHGSLFDPWTDKINLPPSRLNKRSNDFKNIFFKYVSVKEEIFNLYLRYLQTRNNLWKTKADWGIKNG